MRRCARCRSPPSLLITLVENAIKHGIEPRPGPGRIEVAAVCQGDRLRVRVGDDGFKVTQQRKGDTTDVMLDYVGYKLDDLRRRYKAMVGAIDLSKAEAERMNEALERGLRALEVDHGWPPEILAESLRQAALALAGMVGRIGAEDYLDEIFSSFCIGK